MKVYFDRIKLQLKEKLSLYPVLTGILFLINELRKNAVFYTLKENVLLILIVLAFSFLVDFLSRKLIHNKIKAAIAAVLFIFINLYYYDIFLLILGHNEVLNVIYSRITIHIGIVIFILIFFIWLALFVVVLKTRQFSKTLNLYLNLIIIAFIAVEIFKWIFIPFPQVKLADSEPFLVNRSLVTKQKPDIYYILLDSYTSSGSLKKYWNYDNSSFEDSLKKLGFFIPDKIKADYISTHYCLASYLNSSKLLFDSTKIYSDHNLFKLIRTNRLFQWLTANGYECYNYSIFDAFGKEKYMPYSYYNSYFLGRTLWHSVLFKVNEIIKAATIPKTNLKIFSELKHISEVSSDKPKFVYAHLIMPHSPFSFDKNGQPFNEAIPLTSKQKYLHQLIFTNFLALETVNHLLLVAKRDPVIIIQGDHGYRSLDDTTKVERSNEAHTIFYTVHPSEGIIISDTIKPVNTFKYLIEKINKLN